jgi:peroxiredoxin
MAGMMLVSIAGCGKPEEEPEIQNPNSGPATSAQPAPVSAQPAAVASRPAVAARPAVKQPPPRPTIPKVSMSKDLLATCRVQAGDKMPEGQLSDVDGKPQSLGKLFGKRLTVVFFWTAESPYSIGEVEDQNDDVIKDYAEKGVQVIGINQGDSVEKVRAALKEAGVKYPVLLDGNGDYFKKVATEKTLRTYLLDAQGRILWFDTEYSRATRRDLLQAIDAVLSKP